MRDHKVLYSRWSALVDTYPSFEDFFTEANLSHTANMAITQYGIFIGLMEYVAMFLPVQGGITVVENPAQTRVDQEMRAMFIYKNILKAWAAIDETTQFEIIMSIGTDVGDHFTKMLSCCKYLNNESQCVQDFYSTTQNNSNNKCYTSA